MKLVAPREPTADRSRDQPKGVFDFMQRLTDLSPRVVACSRGRRREVGLFLLPVVMLSPCLNTLITDEVNNMQYLSNARKV